MGKRDYAPIGFTCNSIDECQLTIQKQIKQLNTLDEIGEEPMRIVENVVSELESISKNELEQLRKDNEALREWGNELYKQVDDLTSELQDLKEKL